MIRFHRCKLIECHKCDCILLSDKKDKLAVNACKNWFEKKAQIVLRSIIKSHSLTICFNFYIYPNKPSVLFVGHKQTVQNLIRRHKMWRLIRFSTGCLQKFLLKFE